MTTTAHERSRPCPTDPSRRESAVGSASAPPLAAVARVEQAAAGRARPVPAAELTTAAALLHAWWETAAAHGVAVEHLSRGASLAGVALDGVRTASSAVSP